MGLVEAEHFSIVLGSSRGGVDHSGVFGVSGWDCIWSGGYSVSEDGMIN